ncbi:22639_t:CDS:2, partial [Racocetra persica]
FASAAKSRKREAFTPFFLLSKIPTSLPQSLHFPRPHAYPKRGLLNHRSISRLACDRRFNGILHIHSRAFDVRTTVQFQVSWSRHFMKIRGHQNLVEKRRPKRKSFGNERDKRRGEFEYSRANACIAYNKMQTPQDVYKMITCI